MKDKPKKILFHPRVGYSKAKELYVKYQAPLRVLTKGKRQKGVRDVIQEGIVREFIGQYLPRGYEVGRGIVYDAENKRHSPEIDGLVYSGTPLMNFADVVVTEKKQTPLIVQVKSWAKIGDLFGMPVKDKKGSIRKDKNGTTLRDSKTEFQDIYKERNNFGEKYVLFIFSLEVAKKISDEDIKKRFDELSDGWVVVWRKKGKDHIFDYGNSVSKFIEELSNLGD